MTNGHVAPMLIQAALVIGSYLVGAIPIGFLVVKVVRGQDIRHTGSGNIGATNVGRVMGWTWFGIVLALDMLKGFAPCLVAGMVSGHAWGAYGVPLILPLCGMAAICGHNFSVYLRFKGGKGVATSCGVFLYLFWPGTAIAAGVFLAAVLVSRYISVGSMLGAGALAAAALLVPPDPFGSGVFLTAFCILCAALIIARHRANIGRLLAGTENRVRFGKRKTAEDQERE